MAAKPAQPPRRMCVLSLGYQHFVIQLEEATELFARLSNIQQVETVYGDGLPYKLSKSNEVVTLKHLPLGVFEQMQQVLAAELALKE